MLYDLLARAALTGIVGTTFFSLRMTATWSDVAPWILASMMLSVIIGVVVEWFAP
jgi:hypothetical protein